MGTVTTDYQAAEAGASCPTGKNRFPYRYAFPVQFSMLDRWVRTGRPAPSLARHSRTPDGQLRYDPDGNVIGGYRLPVMQVPVAAYSTAGCRSNEGASQRFSQARLRELYPSHQAYLSRLTTATERTVKAGLLLPADAAELLAVARGSSIPNVG